MVVHTINSKAQFYNVIGGEKTVDLADNKKSEPKNISILDCFAPWCGPCKTISPLFAKFSDDPANDKIHFLQVDVDEVPDLAQELGIRAMPTFIVFQDGNKVEEIIGAKVDALQKAVQKYASA